MEREEEEEQTQGDQRDFHILDKQPKQEEERQR